MFPRTTCAAGLLLLAVLAVAVLAPAAEPASTGAPAAAEAGREVDDLRAELQRRLSEDVWDFGFEEELVVVPRREPVPGEWERHLEFTGSPVPGEGEVFHVRPAEPGAVYYGRFPDFMRVDVLDLDRPGTPPGAVRGGRRALRMELSGARGMDMVALRRRVALKVDPAMAYELSGWVRLEGVSREDSWAQLCFEWLDGNGARLGDFDRSVRIDRAYLAARPAGWLPVPVLRVEEPDPRARSVRVWCVASGSEPGSFACFDDLSVRRRPRVTVDPGGPGGLGILAGDEPAALAVRFRGLEPASAGRRVGGYRRILSWTDLMGRTGSVPPRTFGAGDLVGRGLDDRVRLTGLDAPGAYALEIRLEETSPDGPPVQLVRRTLRMVRLARRPDDAPGGGPVGTACAADLDLGAPEAPRLLQAARLCGLQVLAFPVWQREAAPSGLRPAGGEAAAEDPLLPRLRELVGRRTRLEAVLAPAPAALRAVPGAASAPRAGYRDLPPGAWEPLVAAAAERFGPFVSEWRLAAAEDTAVAGPAAERGQLVAELHRISGSVPGRTWTVPVPLDGLAPAGAEPPAGPDFLRELVYVPAGTGADELERIAAASGARRRRWFLELRPAAAGAAADLASERRQAGDLARKLTVLAAHGAERVHVDLADRIDGSGRTRQGLLGPGLAPRAAYAAWCTLAAELAGAAFVDRFDLAPGASAWAFRRGGLWLLVFWADGPEREVPCQLGVPGKAELVELTGARRPLRSARPGPSAPEGAELVPLSELPALLVGVDPAYVLTRRDFRLAPGARLEARYREQEVAFEVRNHFAGPIRALIRPRFPRGTQVSPAYREADIPRGATAAVTFRVRPSLVETAGPKEVVVELRLQPQGEDAAGLPAAAFSLSCLVPLDSPLAIEPAVRSDGRTAEIGVTLRLRGSAASAEGAAVLAAGGGAEAEVSLTVPGALRRTVRVPDLSPGGARQLRVPFSVQLGSEPLKVRLGARVLGEEWFANAEVELPAAGPPR